MQSTSNGEFTGHARSVFLDGAAVFRYAGADTIDGHAALRWNYTITALASGWILTYNGRGIKVASTGSFWAHPESLDVLRLEVNADKIETDFPIAATRLSISYARLQLRQKSVSIPQSSDLLVTDADGTLQRNQVALLIAANTAPTAQSHSISSSNVCCTENLIQ